PYFSRPPDVTEDIMLEEVTTAQVLSEAPGFLPFVTAAMKSLRSVFESKKTESSQLARQAGKIAQQETKRLQIGATKYHELPKDDAGFLKKQECQVLVPVAHASWDQVVRVWNAKDDPDAFWNTQTFVSAEMNWPSKQQPSRLMHTLHRNSNT